MGQMATGLLYGCEAPDLPDDEDGEALCRLVARWEKKKRVDWSYEGPRIRIEYHGGKTLLGVWVAVGGGGEDGAPYFVEEAMPLDQVRTVFQKSIKRAEKLWSQFAAHVAKKEGVVLRTPTLWLTPCEVA